MKMYARTTSKSYLNNYKGEDWAPVRTTREWYPSGLREVVVFPSGYHCKADNCEIVYVFEK